VRGGRKKNGRAAAVERQNSEDAPPDSWLTGALHGDKDLVFDGLVGKWKSDEERSRSLEERRTKPMC
jgi:hypothetical protein